MVELRIAIGTENWELAGPFDFVVIVVGLVDFLGKVRTEF